MAVTISSRQQFIESQSTKHAPFSNKGELLMVEFARHVVGEAIRKASSSLAIERRKIMATKEGNRKSYNSAAGDVQLVVDVSSDVETAIRSKIKRENMTDSAYELAVEEARKKLIHTDATIKHKAIRTIAELNRAEHDRKKSEEAADLRTTTDVEIPRAFERMKVMEDIIKGLRDHSSNDARNQDDRRTEEDSSFDPPDETMFYNTESDQLRWYD